MRDVDDDTPIWRYLRLPAFLEMVTQMSLFQTRVHQFDDALEGAYGYRKVEFAEDLVAFLDPPRRMQYHIYRRNPKPDDPLITAHPIEKEDIVREARRRTVVTCWYGFEQHESYAMWRVFGNDSFALAITTTIGALRRCFAPGEHVAVRGVEYNEMPPRIERVEHMFFHKRPEFKDEREIRSVQVFPARVESAVHAQALSSELLDGLLGRVIAAPGMRDTMFQTLFSTIRAAGLRNFTPDRFRRSSIDADRVPQLPR